MNLSNLLERFQGFGRKAADLSAPQGSAQRIGDVVVAVGVANDPAAPANDASREHLQLEQALTKRLSRLEQRETSALSF